MLLFDHFFALFIQLFAWGRFFFFWLTSLPPYIHGGFGVMCMFQCLSLIPTVVNLIAYY